MPPNPTWFHRLPEIPDVLRGHLIHPRRAADRIPRRRGPGNKAAGIVPGAGQRLDGLSAGREGGSAVIRGELKRGPCLRPFMVRRAVSFAGPQERHHGDHLSAPANLVERHAPVGLFKIQNNALLQCALEIKGSFSLWLCLYLRGVRREFPTEPEGDLGQVHVALGDPSLKVLVEQSRESRELSRENGTCELVSG